jgi:serine/threonine-protein phosphatase PGAM5
MVKTLSPSALGLALVLFVLVGSARAQSSPASGGGAAVAPAATPGTRTLVLVRHGNYDEEDARDERVGRGLRPIGVAQARLVGGRLRALPVRFDALVASPLTRARQTAEVVAAELGFGAPRIDPDLAECTPPTRRADIMAKETAEDLAACAAQLDRLAGRLLAPSPAGDARELVVAHGNVIRYLVTRALAVDPTAWLGMSIGHASLTVIVVDPAGAARVLAVGDVGHLPPAFQTGAWGDPPRDLALP